MPESVADLAFLQGKQVSFTGRLAAMTQADAADLVRARGGTYSDTVNRFTALLIVGQDGWPFESDGRLSSKLPQARSLQRKGFEISVLSEDEFFVRLGLDSPAEGVSRLYSTAQLAGLLKIPGERIRRWAAAGVIRPVKIVENICYFDYGQVVSARTMSELVQAGVKPERLRRSIEQMQRWVGRIEQPLLQLSLLEQDGQLLVRLPDGLADTSGQRYFDFDELLDPVEVTLSRQPATAEELFEQGCRHEESGRFNEAVDAYRYALLMGGPNPTICFNLANVLNAAGNKEQAVERYYQAVELNRGDADAWNNLGVVLSELGRTREAITAFNQVLAIDNQYSDAHYNLADLLDENGQEADAAAHWHAYTAKFVDGARALHARKRLNANGCGN